jgi:hypothetical protein
VRIALMTFMAISLAASIARADRIAIVALESPGQPPPVVEADRLSAELSGKGHRIISSADALARLSSGEQGAGPDWGAEMLQAIGTARAALTRLDRAFAMNAERRIGIEVARRGGGAAGSEVLVEWYLLKRQLSLTASDVKGAARWLDAAIAAGPDIEIDPLRHPDDERDQYFRRRQKLRQEVPAKLAVATTPAAADVWVDGMRRCESPCSVALVPGPHMLLVSSPAHTPAALEVTLGPGTTAARQLGLSAAYAAATPRAIASMISNPSRRAEGASALEPMARFLDVEHVVALVPEGDKVRVLVSPPAAGRSRIGPLASADDLCFAVMDQLGTTDAAAPATAGGSAWYAKPTTWIIGAAIVAGVVGGALIYDASRPSATGTLTVGSP